MWDPEDLVGRTFTGRVGKIRVIDEEGNPLEFELVDIREVPPDAPTRADALPGPSAREEEPKALP